MSQNCSLFYRLVPNLEVNKPVPLGVHMPVLEFFSGMVSYFSIRWQLFQMVPCMIIFISLCPIAEIIHAVNLQSKKPPI